MTPKEISIQQKLQVRLDSHAEKLKMSLVGVYGIIENGDPTHLGTSFVLESNKGKYLVTAGHVLDNRRHVSLKLLTPSGFKNLDQPFFRSKLVNSGVETDPYDIAFLPLDGSLLESISAIETLPASSFSHAPSVDTNTIWAAMGLPNTKNEPDHRTKRILIQPYLVSGPASKCPHALKKLGFSEETHLFMKHGPRQHFLHEGRRINPPKLVGISGGPIFELGALNDAEQENLAIAPLKVVGVTIRQYKEHQIIVGTKVADLPNAIRAFEDSG